MEMRSTVKEMEVFTSCALASKIPFTLQVRLKGPMPWEAQVRVMEESSKTGSGDLGVMNGTGKARGGGRGGKGREGVMRREGKGRGRGRGRRSQLKTCYISQFLTGRHHHGNTTYMLPLTHLNLILQ